MQRDISFDILSGIYIIFMILGAHISHLTGNFSNLGMNKVFFLFTPYLAFFFFKSGYYYNLNHQTPLTSLLKSVLQSKMPVLTVFAIWGVIAEIIMNYHRGFRCILHLCKSIILYLRIPSNGPLWFFITLIVILLLSRVLDRLKCTDSILFVLLLIASWLLRNCDNSIWHLHNIPICMLFFISGRIMKNNLQMISPRIAALILVASLIVNFIFTSYVDLFTAKVVSGNFFLFIILTLLIVISSKVVISHYIKFEIPLLSYIGRNSLVYYALHFPIVLLAIHFLPFIKGNPYFALCLFVIVLFICTLYNILSLHFPILVGKFK